MKEQSQHNEYFLAEWIAGRMSDAELRTLVGDAEFETYIEIRQATDVMQALSKPIKPVWEQIESRMSEEKKPKVLPLFAKVKIILPYAAILLVMLGLYNYFNFEQVVVQTAHNQQKTIWLPNGTQVVLHDEATLKYTPKNWKENPEINIEGNAFIRSNNNSYMFVNTIQGRIAISKSIIELVVNTQLLDITCYKGEALVSVNGNDTTIVQNNKLLFENNHKVVTKTTNILPIWLSGVQKFDNIPLEKVIDSLEQFYQVNIDKNAIDIHQKFTGAVPKYNLKLALFTVFKPVQVQYKLDQNIIILTASKSEK